jgi:hypothetical protein
MRNLNEHFNEDFRRSLINSQANPAVLISFIEDVINYERVTMQANLVLGNELAYLQSENKITHAEILLSLIRVHRLPRC